MEEFEINILRKLYVPPLNSHKGQNGKLLLIGGSTLFHSASIWALKIASKIVDMVFYASIPQNNELIQDAKATFQDGIVIKREDLDEYAKQADCILIGPGMMRNVAFKEKKTISEIDYLPQIVSLEDEGAQTYYLTKYILTNYKSKKVVVDAGALQMLHPSWLKGRTDTLLTPHKLEFRNLFSKEPTAENISQMAKLYNCFLLVKGVEDILCSSKKCSTIKGGNAGLTKGGTGDVLAGLIAALSCKNDIYLAALCGSYFNKKAGDDLYKEFSYFFNASDLIEQLPRTIKNQIDLLRV